ncbi:MAG: hypothetical protein KGJ48_19705, partial [Nitrospirota bacterium]|nr:hypothetical protein [Nitrospirota bacterium]
VNDGWCWWYRKCAPGDTALEGLEKEDESRAERVVERRSPNSAVGVTTANEVMAKRREAVPHCMTSSTV